MSFSASALSIAAWLGAKDDGDHTTLPIVGAAISTGFAYRFLEQSADVAAHIAPILGATLALVKLVAIIRNDILNHASVPNVQPIQIPVAQKPRKRKPANKRRGPKRG